jgi:hypothetical protein
MKFSLMNFFYQTAEGARLQLITDVGRTPAVLVSTLMEAWGILQGGLVADGTIKDVGQKHAKEIRTHISFRFCMAFQSG